MKIHHSCASSVIVHHVPVNSVDFFIEWQRGISQVATSFSGYQTTDVYPPTEDGQLQWVVIIHFDTSEALQRWLHSVERSECIAKLHGEIANFRIESLSTGFASWFAGINKPEGTLPPAWKIALTVLLGLYPTVMLLTLLISPHLTWLGLALSMLIGNALSVSILQWAVMPRLNAWLAPWLQANTDREKALSVGGLVLILLLLGALGGLFHWVMG